MINDETFDDSGFILSPEEELISIVRGTASEIHKRESIIRLFDQEKKPDLDYKYKGLTALNIAVRKKEIRVIDLLVELIMANLTKWWPSQKKLPNSFVEKKDGDQLLVTKLHSILTTDNSAAVVQKAAITGPEGIGKTTTAKWYANKYEAEYDHIFWIDFEEGKAIDNFRSLAVKLKIPITTTSEDGKNTPRDIKKIANDIYTKLKQKNKCLFIFDNADQYRDIEDLLPKNTNLHILITSRNKNLGTEQDHEEIRQLELRLLSEEEALALIRKEALETLITEKDTKSLAKELGYIPLAFQQAVAYIKKNRTTVADYLDKYRKAAEVILNNPNLDDYRKTVLTTWQVTLDKIKEDENLGKLAIKVLNIMSYLSPDDITKEIFQKLPADEAIFLDDVIGLLNDYSLIKTTDKQIDIHHLVQLATRLDLGKKNEEEILRKALRLLLKNNDSEKRENNLRSIWKYASNYKSIVTDIEFKDSANEALLDVAKSGDLEVLEILIENGANVNAKNKYGYTALHLAAEVGHLNIVKFLIDKGSNINTGITKTSVYADYKALHLAAKRGHLDTVKFLVENGADINAKSKKAIIYPGYTALHLAAEVEHLNIVKFLIENGAKIDTAYGSLDNPQKQKELLERALHIKGPECYAIARTLTTLGNAYGDLGDPQKQKELLEVTLAIKEKQYGPDHYEVAKILVNLGNAYSVLGDPQKAKKLLERALDIFRDSPGENHPSTLSAMNNVALTLDQKGDYEEALPLKKQVLNKVEEIFGENHLNTLAAMNNLANTLYGIGEYEEALKLYKKVLDKRKDILDEKHPDILSAMNNLANTFYRKKEYNEALELYKQVLEKKEKISGKNHPDTLVSMLKLSNAYGSLGNHQEQKDLLKKALAIQEKHYGPDHYEVTTTLVELGTAYGNLGDHQKQKEFLESALAIVKKHYAPDEVVTRTLQKPSIEGVALSQQRESC